MLKIYTYCAMLLACSFSSHAAIGKENYKALSKVQSNKYKFILTSDKNMSSRASSDIAMSAIELVRVIDDAAFGGSNKFIDRLLSNTFVVLSVSYIHIAQHEIGGHGARFREFGYTDIHYNIGFFSGYARGVPSHSPIPPHELSSIYTAGMQASHLVAENIKAREIESNTICPTYAIAYNVNQLNQPMYILGSSEDRSGDDISSYINYINSIYGAGYLTKDKLSKYAFIDLLDPFLYYTYYSIFTNKEIEVPMIEIGKVKYLPAMRSVLAPYGPEIRFVNHFKIDDKYFKIDVGGGKNMNFNSYFVGLTTNQILKIDTVSLAVEAAIWVQPELLTLNPASSKMQTGGMLVVNAEMESLKDIRLVLSGGYKTSGFVEGAPLASSGLVKVGLRFDF